MSSLHMSMKDEATAVVALAKYLGEKYGMSRDEASALVNGVSNLAYQWVHANASSCAIDGVIQDNYGINIAADFKHNFATYNEHLMKSLSKTEPEQGWKRAAEEYLEDYDIDGVIAWYKDGED